MSRPRQIGPSARHLDNGALTLWWFLLREGGYWSAGDLRQRWHPMYSCAQLRNILDRLLANGMLREQPGPLGRPMARPGYGVTAKCIAPPGYEWMLTEPLEPLDMDDQAELQAPVQFAPVRPEVAQA